VEENSSWLCDFLVVREARSLEEGRLEPFEVVILRICVRGRSGIFGLGVWRIEVLNIN